MLHIELIILYLRVVYYWIAIFQLTHNRSNSILFILYELYMPYIGNRYTVKKSWKLEQIHLNT